MTDLLVLLIFVFGLAAPVAALLLIDLWLYNKYGLQWTISQVMRRLGSQYPILPFGLGFIIGGVVVGCAVHFWNV